MLTSLRWLIAFSWILQVFGGGGWQVAPQAPLPIQQAAAAAPQFEVRIHPDGWLEVGDQVSFEVFASGPGDLSKLKVQVRLGGHDARLLGQAGFDPQGDGTFRAVMQWAWDTTGLAPGSYVFDFGVEPVGENWTQSVSLRPAGSKMEWHTSELPCCLVHTIRGTLPDAQLDQLLPMITAQAQDVEREFGVTPRDKTNIDLIPRILGQGGFTANEVILSVAQENFMAQDLEVIVHHELVHWVDGTLGGAYRPTVLIEGLAVYLTGGHYKQEPILPRAATLTRLGLYVPLSNLANDFYNWQHEAGYLEAAALVEYMVNTWGREAFEHFYRSMKAPTTNGDAGVMDAALQQSFGISLRQLDDRFYRLLANFPLLPDLEEDVEFSVRYLDQARLYQKEFEPSAYFLQVWLPDPAEMRRRGITADYVRRAVTLEMTAIEQALSAAGAAWLKGDLELAWRNLNVARNLMAGEE